MHDKEVKEHLISLGTLLETVNTSATVYIYSDDVKQFVGSPMKAYNEYLAYLNAKVQKIKAVGANKFTIYL
jgi:hypothetical protein